MDYKQASVEVVAVGCTLVDCILACWQADKFALEHHRQVSWVVQAVYKQASVVEVHKKACPRFDMLVSWVHYKLVVWVVCKLALVVDCKQVPW